MARTVRQVAWSTGSRGFGGQVRPSERRMSIADGRGPSYLCSIPVRMAANAGETSTDLRRWRFRLVVFLVRMWLFIDW